MIIEKLFNFNSEVAIVTGGASGIGKEFSIVLADAGAKAVVADLNLEGVLKTCEEIDKKGGTSIPIEVDVTDKKSVIKMVENVVAEFNQITILANVAGIGSPSPLLEMTLDKFNKVVQVSLNGTFLCSQAVIPYMLEAGRGKIINIGSTAAWTSAVEHPGSHNYSAAKAGILALTRTMALEFAKNNINVNSISPGFIKTPLMKKSLENKEKVNNMLRHVPLNRVGNPSDLSGAFLFLASKASDYVTGHDLLVDGGYRLR